MSVHDHNSKIFKLLKLYGLQAEFLFRNFRLFSAQSTVVNRRDAITLNNVKFKRSLISQQFKDVALLKPSPTEKKKKNVTYHLMFQLTANYH